MLKKLIGVVAVTTMALVASVSITSAQEYPPVTHVIRALNSPSLQFPHTGPAVFEAQCFLPGSTVTFTVNGVVLGNAVADADAVAVIDSTLPATIPPGPATVVATGPSCIDGEVLSLALAITVAGTQVTPGQVTTTSQVPSPGALPRTGSSSSTLAQVAVASIVAGGFLVIMTNRRRTLATVRSSSKG